MLKKVFFLFLLSWFSQITAYAATCTSVANGNWSSVATWDCGHVPATSDDVVIAHTVTFDTDIELIADASITINVGASLLGNATTRRIGYTLSNTGPAITITNRGTMTVGIMNRTNSGGDSNDDYVFDNYGTLNIQDSADCNGSSSSFFVGRGTFTNYSTGVVNSSPCFYVGGGTSEGLLHNYGLMNFNCATCSNGFAAHSRSSLINHPGGRMVAQALFTAGGLNQDNYGCIQALGGIRVFEKSNNGGLGVFKVHDNGVVIVGTTDPITVQSNTTLEGVDDDGNNANNGCMSTLGQVSNSGTITGEFRLLDADGAVSGTVGPNVTLGTGVCATSCTPSVGALQIQKNVTGAPVGFVSPSFTIHIDCSDNSFDQDIMLTDGGSQTISNIPAGTTCTVTEPSTPAPPSGYTYGTPTISPSGAQTITSGATVSVTVTNPLTTGATCSINAPTVTATCTNVGNDSDASNDTFSFTISATGSNTGANYKVEKVNPTPTTTVFASVNYGATSAASSAFLITGGNLTLTLTDNTTTTCTRTNVIVTAPASCSSAPVGGLPDLELTKIADKTTVISGNTITYTLTLKNVGTATATGVKVRDVIPAGLTYVSSVPSQGTYTSGTGIWDVGTVAANATLILTITVTVN